MNSDAHILRTLELIRSPATVAHGNARLKKTITNDAEIKKLAPDIHVFYAPASDNICMSLRIMTTEITDTVYADLAGIKTLIKTAKKTKEIVMTQTNIPKTTQSIMDLLLAHTSQEQDVIVEELVKKSQALQDHIETEKEASCSEGYDDGYAAAQ